jgi:hypothetical protein
MSRREMPWAIYVSSEAIVATKLSISSALTDKTSICALNGSPRLDETLNLPNPAANPEKGISTRHKAINIGFTFNLYTISTINK